VALLRFPDRAAPAAGPRGPATAAVGDGQPPALEAPGALAVPPSLAASPARKAPLNAIPDTAATA
jgi:hypothetical protein